MIKVILIDDERPALRELEFLLKDYEEISIEGMYINPLEALKAIPNIQPHLIFLDIHMPHIQGLDLAAQISKCCEETEIIFVTAYNQYAIEAFELQAMDYLLKPIIKERLEKTIRRFLKRTNQQIDAKKEVKEKKLYIRSFDRLEIAWENQEPLRWRSEKNKEIFAFLLHHRERNVSKEEILDNLWREESIEKSLRQLYNGIYYIRKAMEEYGIDNKLINITNKYQLKICEVEWDAGPFFKLENANYPEKIEELEALVENYTGDYLGKEGYFWAEVRRANFEKIYLKLVIKLTQKLIQNKKWEKAEYHLIKAYTLYPYEEELTELLLKIYMYTEQRGRALQHYKAYCLVIKQELGINPAKKLEKYLAI